MRISRAEWAKRVVRWRDSGLTAKEFAAELGINPRSLVFWKWQLGKWGSAGGQTLGTKRRARQPKGLPMVELVTPAEALRFELELPGGRRLTIPSAFDADALCRLLAVLEPSS
jgi:transposase